MTRSIARRIRRALVDWYDRGHRDLPWRATEDPYRIWLSEIMLQQTRAATVIPYYQRFLERFPNVAALAQAPEAEVLTMWAGLGYYSRARNLQAAAKRVVEQHGGEFPREYESIRALPGVGDYTAAAVASIAFHLPHAVVDGNVLRVLSRVTAEPGEIKAPATRKRLQGIADAILDSSQPGHSNQALMELGATVCLPRNPQCGMCPIAGECEAQRQGRAATFPVQIHYKKTIEITVVIAIIRKQRRLLLRKREGSAGRLAGFWELPEVEMLAGFVPLETVGSFRHSITHHRYTVEVVAGSLSRRPAGTEWVEFARLSEVPLTTISRKALALAESQAL